MTHSIPYENTYGGLINWTGAATGGCRIIKSTIHTTAGRHQLYVVVFECQGKTHIAWYSYAH